MYQKQHFLKLKFTHGKCRGICLSSTRSCQGCEWDFFVFFSDRGYSVFGFRMESNAVAGYDSRFAITWVTPLCTTIDLIPPHKPIMATTDSICCHFIFLIYIIICSNQNLYCFLNIFLFC